jgi:hypothetical protein
MVKNMCHLPLREHGVNVKPLRRQQLCSMAVGRNPQLHATCPSAAICAGCNAARSKTKEQMGSCFLWTTCAVYTRSADGTACFASAFGHSNTAGICKCEHFFFSAYLIKIYKNKTFIFNLI